MSKSSLETQAILLHKEPSNENFLRLDLFSPSHGKLTCLARFVQKKTNTFPDLFDLLTLNLTPAKQGKLFFLKDSHLEYRHSGISKNYPAFHSACQWAKILSLNLSHIDRPEPLFALTLKALQSFEKSPNPLSTYLKTLYLFTRQEGYPIKEDWLINLPPDLLEHALIVLQSPLNLQSLPQTSIQNVIDLLHLWIAQHTDILLPR